MVKIFSTSLTLIMLLCGGLVYAQLPQSPSSLPNIVVFKLKEPASGGTSDQGPGTLSAARTHSGQSAEELAAGLARQAGAIKASQAFPQMEIPAKNSPLSRTSKKSAPSSLSNIYKLELKEGQQPEEAIQFLLSSKMVEYAEPYYLPQLLVTPDDEHIPEQTYLNAIKAFSAWDISQGNKDIIIGILDTGVDFDHPDLKANLYLNTADPIDGIDNDGDGYIDNYRGWDFANNDNDPSADKSDHGTMVTGYSSASTNNDIGIAGTAYKCRYMPLKIFRSENNMFRNGYEAMVYAANMGCHVINLSWGAAGTRSQYVQDIVNYVVLEKDVVIVAAAGNESNEKNYYPASYDNVISVTSSDLNDAKSAYATWSRYVDVMAPGNSVFSTKNGGGYGKGTGTSFASPQVAGAAALIRSYYPELNALQVMERIRVSADDVSNAGTNSSYKEKIGKGRLNMQKALEKTVSPAVRMQSFEIFNGTGPFAFHNDTLELRMNFTNFLSPSTSLAVELSTNSPYVTILNGRVELNQIQTLEMVKNDTFPFRIHLHDDLPTDAVITFRLGYKDINYADYQHFELRTSGDFFDFKADDLSLTISSNGNLGYNFNYNLHGTGFRYKNSSLAHNLGLVLAVSDQAVANNMAQTINPVVRNQDFSTLERLKLYQNSAASLDARSVFKTKNTPESPLKLLVEQKVLAWEDELSSSALVLEYRITNLESTPYPQLHTGVFADFDIHEFYKNKAAWDAESQMGYVFDHLENRFAGVALLNTGLEIGFHALDIADKNGNTSEYADSIKRAQKYAYLANGIGKTTAGAQGAGNDVAQFLGAKLPGLAPNESRKTAFTLVTASSLAGLRQAVKTAGERYLEYLQNPPLLSLILACPGSSYTIQVPEGEIYEFYEDPYGQHLISKGSSLELVNLTADVTIYAANATQAWLGDIGQIRIEVKDPVAAFSMSADTIAFNAGESVMLELTDESEIPAAWLWDFGNGYKSSKQSPKTWFNTAGSYNISLTMTNIANCSESITKKVVVVEKNAAPLIQDQVLCNHQSTTIQTEDGAIFSLYADAEKKEKIFEGSQYTTQVLTQKTIYYATSGSGYYESDPAPVNLEVINSGVGFSWQQDSDTTNHYALSLKASVQEPEKASRTEWYINGTLAEGNTNSLVWPYSPEELSIKVQVIVFYTNGCQAGFNKEIMLQAAPLPSVPPVSLCKGSELRLRPSEEGFYNFYTDAEKKQLVHKGRELTKASWTRSTTFYVTNLSLGGESEATPAKVTVHENIASFSPETDTLSLGSLIKFKSLYPLAVNHFWDFGNGITSNLADPEQLFHEEGKYTISLTAQSAEGCPETLSRTFTVVKPTGIKDHRVINGMVLKLYPNPAENHITAGLPELSYPCTAEIKDLSGRTVSSYKITTAPEEKLLLLDLSSFTAGWYMLHIQDKNGTYTGRIIKD